MGDALETHYAGPDAQPSDPVAVGQSSYPPGTGPSSMPSADVHQQQAYGLAPNAFSSQFDMAHGRGANPYNMNAMANALPPPGYRQGPYAHGGGPPQHRYGAGMPTTQGQQYGVQGVPVQNQQFYLQHPGGVPQYYPVAVPQSSPTPQGRPPSMPFYHGTVASSNQGGSHGGAPYYFPPPVSYPAGGHQPVQTPYGHGRPLGPADPRMSMPADVNVLVDSAEGRQSGVRGPPRKPKQSGHAIWIGNLPPQTDLMNLVHHVCKEAAGLESLFLISKSNCAFANFKDEITCVAAQQKLHDSRFQSVRLVSRLRKSTVEGTSGITAPTGPAATASVISTPTTASTPTVMSVEPLPAHDGKMSPASALSAGASKTGGIDGGASARDKFFILKSLTVEDLDLSVRNGIWATQAHNEQVLNQAFKTADNVYLVFSANKSGEYFGYARMTSEINDDPAAAIEFAPTSQSTNELDLPKAIPTDATEYAPKGRIIDDSARGTIFWEVERDDDDDGGSGDDDGGGRGGRGDDTDEEGEAAVPKSLQDADADADADADGNAKTWGKPFKLEWLSTTKLPFYRTRGLRNPWNSNREVKIARDGTELEPNVGRKLISLFNRVHSPNAVPAMIRPAAMGAMLGYPPMRPY